VTRRIRSAPALTFAAFRRAAAHVAIDAEANSTSVHLQLEEDMSLSGMSILTASRVHKMSILREQ
jgi:hypothetical protein